MSLLPQKLGTLPIFLLLFVLSTGPVVEGDLFWHIKTGEWIWAHKAIPSHDPFTYTFQKEDPLKPGYLRQEIILKGYWLSQIILYRVYQGAGIWGIIVFRASLILLILLSLYILMRRYGAGYSVSLSFLLLSGLWFIKTGDRPHLFSFLLFPWVYYIIENLKKEFHFKDSALLIFLMALWPNLHGGYVTGLAVTGIYLIASLIRVAKGSPIAGEIRYAIILFLSCLATLLNPNTYKPLLGVLQEMAGGVQSRYVAEMMSPFEAFRSGYYYPEFWLALSVTLVIIIVRLKYMPPERLVVLLLFISTSLIHQRMIPFFFLLLPFVALEVERAMPERGARIYKIAGVIFSLALFFPGALFHIKDIFNTDLSKRFPEECTAFLKEAMPEGRLFNWADWGGYLMIYAPEYKLFDDGRRLMDDVEIARDSIDIGQREPVVKGIPLWRSYLDAYKIDIILIPPVHPLFGQFVGLVREIYKDRDFSLVYAGSNCLVYLRKGSGLHNEGIIERYGMPKELAVIKAITALHIYKTEKERKEKRRLIAELYRLIGKEESARQYDDEP
jgi:hypothetical protein